MHEMKIQELRMLGKIGNVTAKIQQGKHFQICRMNRKGVFIPQGKMYVNGKQSKIELLDPFHKSIKLIQTVKLGQTLVAERREGKLIATWKFEQMLKERQEFDM